MPSMSFEQNKFFLEGELLMQTVPDIYNSAIQQINRFSEKHIIFNFSGITRIDSAGVAFVEKLQEHALSRGLTIKVEEIPEQIRDTISIFSTVAGNEPLKKRSFSFFEKIGDFILAMWRDFVEALYIVTDSSYYAIVGLFSKKGMRKGEFINQCVLIGMNALPIVGLVAFLIGFILALQAAAQLRQFGASIFVADLVSISMTREMGPIMTAIIFAGRSGSAIAAEIATMVVTEETDALKSMALNPVRYILVPKMYAISIMMPLLTVLSMIIGIGGALVIGVTYLDIGVKPFYNEVVSALVLKDVLTGLVKSIVFAWIIVLVGAFYGFRVKGGAEGVGKATTASVVASIFMVILADSLLGLIFYFGKGIEF